MIIMHPEIDKNKFKNGLYIVSTPIGNLGDITFRAIEVLKNSKHIFCEDTRVTKKLTSHFNIKSTLISNHKFNESKNLKKIIELLNTGQIVSLVSDAGTPALSDPGRLIVEECVKKKNKYISNSWTLFSYSSSVDKWFFKQFFLQRFHI